MDLATLVERKQWSAGLLSASCLFVHPFRGVGIALNLEILPQFLVSDGLTARQQSLDLLENEGISLDRRGVMGFVDPDVAPDLLSLGRRGHPSDLAQRGNLGLEPFVDGRSGRASSA